MRKNRKNKNIQARISRTRRRTKIKKQKNKRKNKKKERVQEQGQEKDQEYKERKTERQTERNRQTEREDENIIKRVYDSRRKLDLYIFLSFAKSSSTYRPVGLISFTLLMRYSFSFQAYCLLHAIVLGLLRADPSRFLFGPVLCANPILGGSLRLNWRPVSP